MIVRIATEGQYEVADGDVEALNQLDNRAVAACETGNDAAFRSAYDDLLQLIRTNGRALADDELEGSDLILPPPDVSIEEAKEEFSGEGLIPG